MATPPDFTTGALLTAAQMNAVGLWLIKSQVIGTTVSSVSVTSVFSQDFDQYLIQYIVTATSANATVAYSHDVSSGNNYFAVGQEMAWGSATVTGIGPAGTTTCRVGRYDTGLGRVVGQIIVTMPNTATRKNGEFWCAAGSYGNHGQLQIATTSVDTGFTLAPSTGTWSGGTINVYGYRK
jgi:hypothetical protein